MSTPHASTHPAGPQARARLAAYRRYAEIVTEQEGALIAGDVATYEALAAATHELQDRIGLAPTPDLVHDPEAGQASFVDEVADILEVTLAANERIRARLGGMRGTRLGEVLHAAEEGSMDHRYDGGELLVSGSSFDLRF